MAISGNRGLSKISLLVLFGKHQEHEIELDPLERHELTHHKLEKHEGRKVKVRSLTVKSKYDSVQEEESQYEDDEDDVLIKKFGKFLRKEKTKKISQREASL